MNPTALFNDLHLIDFSRNAKAKTEKDNTSILYAWPADANVIELNQNDINAAKIEGIHPRFQMRRNQTIEIDPINKIMP